MNIKRENKCLLPYGPESRFVAFFILYFYRHDFPTIFIVCKYFFGLIIFGFGKPLVNLLFLRVQTEEHANGYKD